MAVRLGMESENRRLAMGRWFQYILRIVEILKKTTFSALFSPGVWL
jgi:hypothetical protein